MLISNSHSSRGRRGDLADGKKRCSLTPTSRCESHRNTVVNRGLKGTCGWDARTDRRSGSLEPRPRSGCQAQAVSADECAGICSRSGEEGAGLMACVGGRRIPVTRSLLRRNPAVTALSGVVVGSGGASASGCGPRTRRFAGGRRFAGTRRLRGATRSPEALKELSLAHLTRRCDFPHADT